MLKKTTSKKKSVSIFTWVLISIGFVLLFPLYRYIRKQMDKNEQQKKELLQNSNFLANKDEPTLNVKLNKIHKSKSVQAAAKDLAYHLGTKFSDAGNWWDFANPKGWFENDNEVEKILIFQRRNYGLLILMYKEITNSRSLSNDIRAYLDSDNLARVRKYLNI